MTPFTGYYRVDPLISYACRPGRRTARLQYQTWLEAIRNRSPPVFSPSLFNLSDYKHKLKISWPRLDVPFSLSDEKQINFWRTCPKPTLATQLVLGLALGTPGMTVSAPCRRYKGSLQYTCMSCGLSRKDANHCLKEPCV